MQNGQNVQIVELYVVTGKASLSTPGRLSVTAAYAMQI